MSKNNHIIIKEYDYENNSDNRPSWDEYFKEIVEVTRKRSPCKRLQVGCLFVKDNRIISQSYNGFLPGCQHISIMHNNHEVGTIHAEQNAILDCAKRGVSCKDCIVYITHFPCATCAKLLTGCEVKEIKYIDDYNNDVLSYEYLSMKKIQIHKLE